MRWKLYNEWNACVVGIETDRTPRSPDGGYLGRTSANLSVITCIMLLFLMVACSTTQTINPTPRIEQTTTPTFTSAPIEQTITPASTSSISPQASVTFTSEDGVLLAGTIFGRGSTAVVLAHQGTPGANQTSWYPFAKQLGERGFTVLTFDFRGIGDSEGELVYSELDKDVKAAIQYLRENEISEIICVGASMGGTACARAALEDKLEGLVLLASGMVAGLGQNSLTIKPEEFAGLTLPKLFITAQGDFPSVVNDTKKMYELSANPKEIYILPGTKHGTDLFETEVREELTAILNNFIKNPEGEISPEPILVTKLEGTIGPIYSLTYSPEGDKLAAAGYKLVKIWDASALHELGSLEGHASFVWGVDWSPDGQYLASASQDGTVQLWDANTFENIGELRTGWAFSVDWSPDSLFLAAGTQAGPVQIWEMENMAQVQEFAGTSPVISLAWKPDGELIAQGLLDGKIIVRNVEDGAIVNSLIGNPQTRSDVNGLVWSPDGTKLVSAHQDEFVRIWGLGNDPQKRLALEDHQGWVRGLAWSPNNRCIASGGQDANVKIWDASDGDLLTSLSGGTQPIWSLSWSPSGQILAAADGIYLSSTVHGIIWIWDIPGCGS